MSQIINPERRDPGHLKSKADVGLSKVDNLSAKELQDLVHGALREEYATGEVYAREELSKGEEVNIPLLKFIGRSSRATILLGFLSNKESIESYTRLTLKHSFDAYSSSINGEQRLEVEIEGSPNRTFFNSKLDLYYSNPAQPENSNFAELYLNIPSGAGNLNGITINITEEIIAGIGDTKIGTVEVLNHTILTKPSKNPSTTILLSKSDREVSSFSRSLAIYDSQENIYYPDTTTENNIPNNSGYNFPTINGVPFTGERNLKYDGTSLRNITIKAQHSGSSKKDAGGHDWEVLNNVRVVGYNDKGQYFSKTINNQGSSETVGLCRLCDIPKDYDSSASIYELLDNMNTMVEGENDHVVSRGFLKKYNALLRRLIGLVVDGGGLSGGTSSDNGVVGNIQFYHNDQLLTYLGISPTKDLPTQFTLSGKISYNTEFTLAAKVVKPFEDQDAKFKIEIIGGDNLQFSPDNGQTWIAQESGDVKEITENSRLRFFSKEEEDEVGDKTFKIQVTNTASSATINQLNAKAVGGLSIYRYVTGEKTVKQEIGYITIKPRYSPTGNNSIFYRRFNSDKITLPFVFSEVEVEDETPKYTKDYFDCYTKGEKDLDSSSGLIWEDISSTSSDGSLVNYSYQPGIILPPKSGDKIIVYCYSMIYNNELKLEIPNSLSSFVSGTINRTNTSSISEEKFEYEDITSSSDQDDLGGYLWKIELTVKEENTSGDFRDIEDNIKIMQGDSTLAVINLSQRAKPYSFTLDKYNDIRFYGSIKFDKVTSYIPINSNGDIFSETLFELRTKDETQVPEDKLTAVLFKGKTYSVTNSLYLKKGEETTSGGYKSENSGDVFLKLEGKYSAWKNNLTDFYGLDLYIIVKEDLFYLNKNKYYPKEYLDYPIKITLGGKDSLFHKTFEPKLSNLRFGPFHGIKNNGNPKDDFNIWLTEKSKILFDQTETATTDFNNAGYYTRQYSQTAAAAIIEPDMDYMLVGLYNRGNKTNPEFVKGDLGNWSWGENKDTKDDTGLLQVVLHDGTTIIKTDGTSDKVEGINSSLAVSGQLFNYDEGKDELIGEVYTLPSQKDGNKNVLHGENITTMKDGTERDDYKWKNKTTMSAPGFVLSFNDERSGAKFRYDVNCIYQDPEYLKSSDNWKNVWRLGIFVNSSDTMNVSDPYYYLPDGDSKEVWSLLDLKLRLTSPDDYK